MIFSSHSSVSHIIIDHLVKRPLSLAWAVPEFNPITKATIKEQSKYRTDSE